MEAPKGLTRKKKEDEQIKLWQLGSFGLSMILEIPRYILSF